MRLSLRRLILLTLLALTLSGAAAVGIISYRAARVALEQQAIRLTGLVAENRRMSLLRTLTRQRDRLTPMLDPDAALHVPLTGSERACLAGSSGETIGADYRGVPVIQAYLAKPIDSDQLVASILSLAPAATET